MSLIEDAKREGDKRNKKWGNAWDIWLGTTFIDHILAKIWRAYNNLNNNPTEENLKDIKGSLIDAFNYGMELRDRYLNSLLEVMMEQRGMIKSVEEEQREKEEKR